MFAFPSFIHSFIFIFIIVPVYIQPITSTPKQGYGDMLLPFKGQHICQLGINRTNWRYEAHVTWGSFTAQLTTCVIYRQRLQNTNTKRYDPCVTCVHSSLFDDRVWQFSLPAFETQKLLCLGASDWSTPPS